MAPNGWVIYIGRGDCRTDAQRGDMIGPARRRASSTSRTATSASAAATSTSSTRPHNGTVNSGDTLAGILPVYGDRGGGDEINGKFESGLLGVTASPDFAQTGHIYLQYFPTFNPDNPVHPGLADGDERRITKMGQARISRFTINLADQEARPQLRGRDLRVRRPRSAAAATRAAAWASTPRATSTSPPATRTRRRARTATRATTSPRAARPATRRWRPTRTAAAQHLLQRRAPHRRNTNDYNGKMLRFNPIDTIPGRGAAGGRHRHHLHAADRGLAERPEPLRRHRGRRR